MKQKKGSHAGTENRRRDIIRAALACFSEIGFAETSMADIRQRSKASTGSIYHHFKSKEQLASQVYLEGISDYQSGLIEELEKHNEAEKAIYSIVSYHLNWIRNNPQWSSYLFQKRHSEFMPTVENDLLRLNREFIQRTNNWISLWIKAGAVKDLPPDIILSIILGPCMEYTRQFLSGQANSEIDSAIAQLSEAVWRAIASPWDRRKVMNNRSE